MKQQMTQKSRLKEQNPPEKVSLTPKLLHYNSRICMKFRLFILVFLMNNLLLADKLIKYTDGGEFLSVENKNPVLLIKSSVKSVSWIAPEKPLDKNFNLKVKLSNVNAYAGGYQFRLVTSKAMTLKHINNRTPGANIVNVYFAAKEAKPHKIFISYLGLDSKIYSFSYKSKWVSGWKPTAVTWKDNVKYTLEFQRKDNELVISLYSSEKKLLSTIPLNLGMIEGGTTPSYFMFGDTMDKYSGGQVEIHDIELNGKAYDLKELCLDLPIRKQLSCGLPTAGIFKFGKHDGYLQTPKNYTRTNEFPFILFFHGRGGSAQNNNFTSTAFNDFRTLCYKNGYIVAVPGYGSDGWFNQESEKITMEMIRFLESRLKIDPTRFYVMGCSMGGAAALLFTIKYPEKVKAVCDIFGITNYTKFYNEGFYNKSIMAAYGGTPQEVADYYAEQSAINHINILKSKRLMLIHGTKDHAVPKWNSDELFAKLKAVGANVKYLEIPNIGHNNLIIKGLENKILDFFKP